MANIKITDLDVIASWKYNSKNSDCVCNRSLQLPMSTQINKKKIYSNNIVFGECGHAFHTECINAYLKTYNMCPLDKLKFMRIEPNYKIKYNISK